MRWEDGQGPQGRKGEELRCWNSRQLGLAQGLVEFPEAREAAGLQWLFLQMYCVMTAVTL